MTLHVTMRSGRTYVDKYSLSDSLRLSESLTRMLQQDSDSIESARLLRTSMNDFDTDRIMEFSVRREVHFRYVSLKMHFFFCLQAHLIAGTLDNTVQLLYKCRDRELVEQLRKIGERGFG